MKWTPLSVLMYLIVGVQGRVYIEFATFSRGICGAVAPNHTKLCLEMTKDYDVNLQSNNSIVLHDKVNSSYTRLERFVGILESRVNKSQINLTIHSSQSFDRLEIRESGHLLAVHSDFGNFSLADGMNLDTASIPLNLTNYTALDDALNVTMELNESLKSLEPIVKNEVVWVNQSVTINGSCCMMANVSLAPGQQLFTTNLEIEKFSDGASLRGAFSWGFIKRDEHPKQVSGAVTFTQTVDATNSAVNVPSYPIHEMVINDIDGLTIYGNVSFRSLKLERALITGESINPINSLFLIEDDHPSDYCYFNFSKASFNFLAEPSIGNVNLTHLLTHDTDQFVDTAIQLKEMKLSGSVITKDHQFAEKWANRLSRIVNSSTYQHLDRLNLNTINVINLTTPTWNDYLLIGLNGLSKLFNVMVSGSVNFSDHVNGLHWDRDLIQVDDTEIYDEIECSLIFVDHLIISDDLAGKSLERVVPNNWVVDGDLAITKGINDQKWDKLISSLVHFNKQTDSLIFDERVEIANCNFGIVDGIDSVSLLKTRNISSPLKVDNLHIDRLILDQVNIASCLVNDHIDSDKGSPIEMLTMSELKIEGTINEIIPIQFLVNRTDQDFIKSNGRLIAANALFNTISASEHSNCETPILNGLPLHRLLRADPELAWPDTVFLKSSNLTNLTSPSLTRSFANLMLDNTDQEIRVNFLFEDQTEFTKDIHVTDMESSINMLIDLERLGDIKWDKLVIDGNLSANRVYNLSSMEEMTIQKGMAILNKLIVNKIESESLDGVIYADEGWKVHQLTTISKSFDLVVNNLIIDYDLGVDDDRVLPWLGGNSLDGIEYYHEVSLENLSTNFKGELTYDQLECNSLKIQLDDIRTSSTDTLTDLQFDGSVAIGEDFTSDSDVDMNLLEIR